MIFQSDTKLSSNNFVEIESLNQNAGVYIANAIDIQTNKIRTYLKKPDSRWEPLVFKKSKVKTKYFFDFENN